MRQLSELRRIQVRLIQDWTDVRLDQLEPGDVFRMYEPDGTRVRDRDGRNMWVVLSRAAVDADSLDPADWRYLDNVPGAV